MACISSVFEVIRIQVKSHHKLLPEISHFLYARAQAVVFLLGIILETVSVDVGLNKNVKE